MDLGQGSEPGSRNPDGAFAELPEGLTAVEISVEEFERRYPDKTPPHLREIRRDSDGRRVRIVPPEVFEAIVDHLGDPVEARDEITPADTDS